MAGTGGAHQHSASNTAGGGGGVGGAGQGQGGEKKSGTSSTNSNSKSVVMPGSQAPGTTGTSVGIGATGTGGGGQSPSVSIIVAPRQHSMIVDDASSNDQPLQNTSFSRSNVHMPSLFSSANGGGGGTASLAYGANSGGTYGRNGGAALSGGRTGVGPFKYEAEFQELQLILLWFPEEVNKIIKLLTWKAIFLEFFLKK